jgi:hypothetical protein
MDQWRASDPLDRYASELVGTAIKLADKAMGSDSDRTKLALAATEICYFLIEIAQRSAASNLNETQMADLIPRLVYRIFDAFAQAFVPKGVADAEFDEYRAGWINTGADRGDFYTRLDVRRQSGGQLMAGERVIAELPKHGTVADEAAKAVRSVIGPGMDMMTSAILPIDLMTAALAMRRDDLLKAARE